MCEYDYDTTVKLSQEDRKYLAVEFTTEDLHAALKQMKKNKSPGPDGLTVEFYLRYWDLVKTHMYDSFVEAVAQE